MAKQQHFPRWGLAGRLSGNRRRMAPDSRDEFADDEQADVSYTVPHICLVIARMLCSCAAADIEQKGGHKAGKLHVAPCKQLVRQPFEE